jgi:hypothetical protein
MPTKNRKALLVVFILLAIIFVGAIGYVGYRAITDENKGDNTSDALNQDLSLSVEETNEKKTETTLALLDFSIQSAASKDEKDAALLAKASFLTVAGRYSESLDIIKPLDEGYSDLTMNNKAGLLALRAQNFAKTGKFNEAAIEAEKLIALNMFGDDAKAADSWQQAYNSLTNNVDPFVISGEDSE